MTQHVGIVAQQHIGVIQQVIEIHGSGRKAPVAVYPVDFMNTRTARIGISPHNLTVGCIFLRGDKSVFSRGDRRYDRRWFVYLFVKRQVLDDSLYKRF